MVDVNLKVPALEKLVDYTASGIGAVAGPMLAPWRARQDAKARLLEAQADADSLRLIAGAQADAQRSLLASGEAGHGVLEVGPRGIEQRIEFQEQKRQANIASVVREAAAELGDKEIPDHEPDPDWTARFFNEVQDVSSKELQKIWSKILAGEVETPGRTSLRTLSILKNMSRRHAETFSTLSRYAIDNFIHEESFSALTDILSSFFVVEMQELGLVHGLMDLYWPMNFGNDGANVLQNCSNLLIVEGEPGKEIAIHGHVLTGPGREMAQFCVNESDLEYLKHFAKFLAGHDCTLKIAPIITVDSQGQPVCSRKDLRLVEPAP